MKNNFEPHFDDERTLLTAQPVVPLEKINAKARHRKQWFLGGAFAVAMMLGAASALLASYFKMRNVQPVSVEVEVTPEDSPVEAPAATLAAVEQTTDTEVSVPENTPKKQPVVKRKLVVPKTHDYVAEPSDNRNMSEDDQLHQLRDAVLYDEWQERRARRVWRRERRRAERYNHRDLSNLDEIFEGRRRPNP